jgi:hypothetical protein
MQMNDRLIYAFLRIGALGYVMGFKFASCFLLAYYGLMWLMGGDWE